MLLGLFLTCFGFSLATLTLGITLHPDHAGAKSEYALYVLSGLGALASVGFGALIYRWSERKRSIRLKLAQFSLEGRDIVTECHEAARNNSPAPDDEADGWNARVAEYLQQHLGDDYAVRFMDHSGLPLGMTILSPPYSHIEGYVRGARARLTEFMKEIVEHY